MVELMHGLHPKSSKVVKLVHGLHQKSPKVVELEVGFTMDVPVLTIEVPKW